MAEDKIMTVGRLAKILTKLVEDGHGKRFVSVYKTTLDTGNDTFDVCDIYKAEIETIRIADGDGFTEFNQDGSERSRDTLLLRGRWWDADKHQGMELLEKQLERAENEARLTREHIDRIKAQKLAS